MKLSETEAIIYLKNFTLSKNKNYKMESKIRSFMYRSIGHAQYLSALYREDVFKVFSDIFLVDDMIDLLSYFNFSHGERKKNVSKAELNERKEALIHAFLFLNNECHKSLKENGYVYRGRNSIWKRIKWVMHGQQFTVKGRSR